MNNGYKTLFLVVVFKFAIIFAFECISTENCSCSSKNFVMTLQCWQNFTDPEIQIQITHFAYNAIDVSIECHNFFNKIDFSFLSLLTLKSYTIETMDVIGCPLVLIKQLVRKFEFDKVNSLFLTDPMLYNNYTITGDIFFDFPNLEILDIQSKIPIYLRSFIGNMPNLIQLSLSNCSFEENIFVNSSSLAELDVTGSQSLNYQLQNFHLFESLNNLNILILMNNDLESLNEYSLRGLFQLDLLDLSRNKIKYLSHYAFVDLKELTHIALNRNELVELPEELFQNNVGLLEIDLSRNSHLSFLANNLFSNLENLVRIDLSYCNLSTIPENLFERTENLKEIDLGYNNLKMLPSLIFTPLKESLTYIYLVHNQDLVLVDYLFSNLTKLSLVDLSYCNLKSISGHVFEGATQLDKLYLNNNFLTTLPVELFHTIDEIHSINIAHNNLKKIGRKLLDGKLFLNDINLQGNQLEDVRDVEDLFNLHNVKEIDLSYNNFHNFSLNKPKPASLMVLNLEHNRITYIKLSSLIMYALHSVSILLSYNNITTVSFQDFDPEGAPLHIKISNNPFSCDCHNVEFVKYFTKEIGLEITEHLTILSENLVCNSPVTFKDLAVPSLSPSDMLCPAEEFFVSSDKCSTYWRPFDQSIIFDCQNKNLTSISILVLQHPSVDFKQVVVYLQNNSLTDGPRDPSLDYYNVTELYLSYNSIVKLTWVPSSVKVLDLKNNKLEHISDEILTQLSDQGLSSLSLENNRWRCDCAALNLIEFLRSHPKMLSTNKIFCSSHEHEGKLLVSLSKNELCYEWSAIPLIIALLSIFLLLTMLMVVYYRYQQEIKVWLFSKNWCLWWVTEEELDKDKLYDAFISFSHKDEDFVLDMLIPELESGPRPYKLCLHFKHWNPGEFISKHIFDSVFSSRRTIVVLSHNFLNSVWAKMEFRTAHSRAMTEGRTRLIVIVYEEVNIDSLDEELKVYLKTNTYLKWGDPYFWNKLRYAMPHVKMKCRTVSFDNVTVKDTKV